MVNDILSKPSIQVLTMTQVHQLQTSGKQSGHAQEPDAAYARVMKAHHAVVVLMQKGLYSPTLDRMFEQALRSALSGSPHEVDVCVAQKH